MFYDGHGYFYPGLIISFEKMAYKLPVEVSIRIKRAKPGFPVSN